MVRRAVKCRSPSWTPSAVEYLADLGRTLAPAATDRRAALAAAFSAIGEYERDLCRRLLEGLGKLEGIRIWGITDPERSGERVPTISFTHDRRRPQEIAEHLAERAIFVWHGNYYAQPVTEALGLEPDGMVRVGLLHYNTAAEVDRLLAVLAEAGC